MIEYKIDRENPDPMLVRKAAEAIKAGKVIIFPSDTSYGLACDATDRFAIDKLRSIKKDHAKKPISVIIKDLQMAEKYASFDDGIRAFFQRYVPGQITLVMPIKLPRILPAENPSFRIPGTPITNLLSEFLEIPYTATSANVSRYPEAYTPEEVYKYFGKGKPQPDIFLNAGPMEKTQTSTVVDLTVDPPKILRQGPVYIEF